MRQMYLMIFGLLSVVAQSQTVNIPDVRLKQYLTNVGTGSSLGYCRDLDGNNTVLDANDDNEVQVSEALNVGYLAVNLNVEQWAVLSFQGIEAFQNLRSFSIQNLTGPSGPLDLHGMTDLKDFHIDQCNVSQINLSGCTALEDFYANSSQTQLINVDNCVALKTFLCYNNQALTSLDVHYSPNLTTMECYGTTIANINLQGCVNLYRLHLGGNPIVNLDFNGLTNIHQLYCGGIGMQSVDVSMLPNLKEFYCNGAQIEYVYMKNGSQETTVSFALSQNLKYVCRDPTDYQVDGALFLSGINAVTNNYCSFTPGGTHYVIQGNNRYDVNSNGCEASDINYPYLRFNLTNSAYIGTQLCDASGHYTLPVEAGTHVMTPVIENPLYFTVSPTTASVNFPTQASPLTQDFCISKNGVHPDLEVYFYSNGTAEPGFNNYYQLVFRNKGTEMQSGSINVSFPSSIMQLVSSGPGTFTQNGDSLVLGFSNLAPFETRSVNLVLRLNSPMDTPPVVAGQLNFTASIETALTDETPADNSFNFRHRITGPFDPNNKICLQGDSITPEMVGKFVYYTINFENIGNGVAHNVVVKDAIDANKFDLNSLTILNSSDPMVTRIAPGYPVEFIFENIELPFDDANNDGFVTFKIKTKPNLVAGNSFSNTASIYFDYNLPIQTNTATTTIAVLGKSDFTFDHYFTIYPNPTSDWLKIDSKQNIEVQSISIYNTLGQLVLVVPNAKTTKAVDVSGLQTGNYFIKIHTDKGTSNARFIKN